MAEKKKLKLTAEMLDQPIFDTLTMKQKERVLELAYKKDPELFMDKGGDVKPKKKKKPKDAIGIMVAVGKVKGKPKMSYGGSIGGKKYNYAAGGSVTNNLKPVPQGNKGKGLSKLPTQVRNKMGFMRKGGMV